MLKIIDLNKKNFLIDLIKILNKIKLNQKSKTNAVKDIILSVKKMETNQ